MMKIKKTRFQKAWQLFVLFGSLAAVITMLEFSAELTQRNYQALSGQTQQLSRLMARQAAETAAMDIIEKDQEKLQTLVKQLVSEPLILDATIYDIEGATVAKNIGAMPLTLVTGLSTPLSVGSFGRQQLVEPIMNQNQIVGFLRLTLEHDKILSETQAELAQTTNMIRGLILTALMIGFLIAFTFGRRKDIWHFPFLLTANSKE
ncbi:YtjB family periplasmic protein [Photobacterium nomapromontoriensis]|uniref:YtjB family periplasmic protein n=1 Tax=Photobacterium nomapromontoriensis TaxID=2910237 RepID=UPI003D0B8008